LLIDPDEENPTRHVFDKQLDRDLEELKIEEVPQANLD